MTTNPSSTKGEVVMQKKYSSEQAVDIGVGIKVELFHNFEDLSSMQVEWDQFVESIVAEIFLTFDWCRTWWKYYGDGRSLMIFTFRHEGTLVGILPVFLEKIWIGPFFGRVIKIVGTDFMPVTVAIPVKSNHLSQVLAAFIKELNSYCDWDLLYIGAICGRYRFTDQLVETLVQLCGGSHHVETVSNDVQTYLQLAESWEKQVLGLAQRRRTNARRTLKEVREKQISVISSLASNETFKEMYVNFVNMHQAQWHRLGMPGHFGAWPSSYEFHMEVAGIQHHLNRLRLLEIKFDDQVVGYEYMYKCGDTYCWFLNSRTEFDKDWRPDFKWIAFAQMHELALKEKVACIDAMRGTYEYKIFMGGKPLPIKNVLVYPRKLPARIRLRAFVASAWLLDVCYSKLWRNRIEPRFGITPGVFWRTWIKTHMLTRLR